MSQYTTGEMAKRCGVTVRAVQYYDTRGILSPSALSEGGRRLYSEADLQRLKVICFLRELDLPIESIRQLLDEEDPARVVTLLLEQQAEALRGEIAEKQGKLDKLTALRRDLERRQAITVESIGDIAVKMENRIQLRRMHRRMLATGLPVTALQWVAIALWIVKGLWIPFAVYTAIAVVYGIAVTRVYFRRTAYLCPQCHKVFKPALKQAFWARHTPNTRKLTCTECGHHGFCIEVWDGE